MSVRRKEEIVNTHSFIIPILTLQPNNPYNIHTLLDDLKDIPGEVICIFNSQEAFTTLKNHPRINQYIYNNQNVGVSRSWNQGMDIAQGDIYFIFNDDIKITETAINQLSHYIQTLSKAVIVGPQGTLLNFNPLSVRQKFDKGTFTEPVQTHDIGGFLFCIHAHRFLEARLRYDPQFTPCFFEEWDMGLQVLQADLACYAVPVTEYDHQWGTSVKDENTVIHYLNTQATLKQIMADNQKKFMQKWSGKTILS